MISQYSFEDTIAEQIFNALRTYVVRSRTVITAIFLGLYNENEFTIEETPETEEKITGFLKHTTRKSDFVFKFAGQTKWFIILSQSGERGAAFLRRLYILVKKKASLPGEL